MAQKDFELLKKAPERRWRIITLFLSFPDSDLVVNVPFNFHPGRS